MDPIEEISDFYGVYLLVSKSEISKYAGHTYIGYTVDPNRRIGQHNRGTKFGGAKKTSNKGPWIMVMIIHGFPDNISALRFEWAWQQPKVSRRLKHIPEIQRRKNKESHFDYSFRILTEMLRVGPWNRLPLTIRWMASNYSKDFEIGKAPPMHMPICYGRVKRVKKKPQKNVLNNMDEAYDEFDRMVMNNNDKENVVEFDEENNECLLCNKQLSVNDVKLKCVNPKCKLLCHIQCLAKTCLEKGQYLPIQGDCPICDTHFLWGDIIRKLNGCNDIVDDLNNTDIFEVDDISDEENNE